MADPAIQTEARNIGLAYVAPTWRLSYLGPLVRRRVRTRRTGNVIFLPPPCVGYRIRHHAAGSSVEVKPRRAPAQEICRCRSVADARSVLVAISGEHARPFLGEIWERAA